MTIRGAKPIIEVCILDTKYTYRENTVVGFEWRSMINCGFMVKMTVLDTFFGLLTELLNNFYIESVRKKPIPIKFKISWDRGDAKPGTPWRTAIMTDLDARGAVNHGTFSFVAVDPISYYLNWGNASGKSYFGKIGGSDGVLHQVMKDYIPDTIEGISVTDSSGTTPKNIKTEINIDDTTDVKSRYYMMRQDPKSFVQSLLDWSCSFTKKNTSWLVSVGEDTVNEKFAINVVESYTPALKNPQEISEVDDGKGELLWNIDSNIYKWEFYSNHMLSIFNNKLVTSGISASSGEFIDPISDPDEKYTYVTDKNTENKLRIPILNTRGFTKPDDKPKNPNNAGWSYVHSIPEFGGGEPHLWYRDYISGRARQRYMEMLPMIMRMKITVSGEPRLFSNDDLGKAQILLSWPDRENAGKTRFMNGPWVLYGWHHKLKPRSEGIASDWLTDVYIYRIDWDAIGLPNAASGSIT